MRREVHQHLEGLPGWCNTVVGDALSELTHLDERVGQYDKHIAQIAKEDEQSRQLMQLAGVGPTTASAIVATVGKGHDFSCGREFCAWLGLVPGQYSSGGQEQNRPSESLGNIGTGETGVLESRGGHRGQECPHVLGHAAAWRGVQDARVVSLAGNPQFVGIDFVVADVTV